MIDLATWQYIFDRRNNELLSKLHEEIVCYDILKIRWGYGHIELRTKQCDFDACNEMYGRFKPDHMTIHGHYVDIHNRKKKVFLGYNFKDALRDVNDKSVCILS